MLRALLLSLSLLLAGCAGYGGADLVAGVAREADVRQAMGVPAMQWTLPGGGRQLAYPRGPAGYETFMVHLDAAGRLERIENVLDMTHFARIQPDMTQEEVLQLLGPSQPQWTVFFERLDELVWEWRYCDAWNEPARFNVLFDNTTGLVRSTQSYTESMLRRFREVCSR